MDRSIQNPAPISSSFGSPCKKDYELTRKKTSNRSDVQLKTGKSNFIAERAFFPPQKFSASFYRMQPTKVKPDTVLDLLCPDKKTTIQGKSSSPKKEKSKKKSKRAHCVKDDPTKKMEIKESLTPVKENAKRDASHLEFFVNQGNKSLHCVYPNQDLPFKKRKFFFEEGEKTITLSEKKSIEKPVCYSTSTAPISESICLQKQQNKNSSEVSENTLVQKIVDILPRYFFEQMKASVYIQLDEPVNINPLVIDLDRLTP